VKEKKVPRPQKGVLKKGGSARVRKNTRGDSIRESATVNHGEGQVGRRTEKKGGCKHLEKTKGRASGVGLP